jgi:hypothetical protein
MNPAKQHYFFPVIQHLRQQEEVVLYGNIMNIEADELSTAAAFLQNEYQQEALEYPSTAPAFDEEAAIWGAKIFYITAQLLLYRENKESDLALLLPGFDGACTPSAALSADLCLRFLPDMLVQLKLIDPEDALIDTLEALLSTWHYSGIAYPLVLETLDFMVVLSDPCLQQLYINRVMANKRLPLANHPSLNGFVRANLGIFAPAFWNEFKTGNHEQHR